MKKTFCILLLILLSVSFTAQAEGFPLPILMRNGGSFALLVKADGSIWGWGDNRMGQLGYRSLVPLTKPRQVAEGLDGNDLADIQCGNENTLFLKKDGTVYTCGSNENGMQGIGSNADIVSAPTQIPELVDVTAISCGFVHNVALDRSGHIWAWGRNNCGQLGIGDTRSRKTPVMVPLENVVAVACGGKFVLALDVDGVFWGWGSNEYGVLSPEKKPYYSDPIQVPGLKNGTPVSFGCGSDCAFILDDAGDLWAWGRNDFGQLGSRAVDGDRSEQKVRVDIDEKVTALTAYSSHTIALAASGNAYVWGSTSTFQLGTGKSCRSSYPTIVWQKDAACVAVGSLFTSLLTADGTFYSCGYNAYGQQGNGSTVTKGVWETNGMNAFR